jgi:Protein of unknown function (DUF3592)
VFAVVGPVLVVRGIRSLRRDTAFQRRAYRAQGVVTQIRWDHRGEDSSSYPVVRFNLPDGRTVEASATQGAGPGSGSEGDSVSVLYDPENPTDIRIEGFFGSGKMGGVVLIVMGVIFFIMGVFIGSIFALVG